MIAFTFIFQLAEIGFSIKNIYSRIFGLNSRIDGVLVIVTPVSVEKSAASKEASSKHRNEEYSPVLSSKAKACLNKLGFSTGNSESRGS